MNVKHLAATVLPLAVMALGEPPRPAYDPEWRRKSYERERNRVINRPLTKGEQRNRKIAGFIGKPLDIPCNNARTRALRGLPALIKHSPPS